MIEFSVLVLLIFNVVNHKTIQKNGIYYAPPIIGGGILKRCFFLMSVCLSVAYIGPKSKTQRPGTTKIGREITHITRDSDTTFKVQGQDHEATLITAALTCKVTAAVSEGTYSAWVKYCYVASARRRGNGGEEGHIVSPRAQLVLSKRARAVRCTVMKFSVMTHHGKGGRQITSAHRHIRLSTRWLPLPSGISSMTSHYESIRF